MGQLPKRTRLVLHRCSADMSTGGSLRKKTIDSDHGMQRIQSGGWSIVMSGGPNDPIGTLQEPAIWRISGKRMNGQRPSPLHLNYLRRVALEAGAPDVAGDEIIVGTWHWSWHEIDGISVLISTHRKLNPDHQ